MYNFLHSNHRYSKYLRGFFIVDALPVLPLEFLIVLFESLWYLTSLNILKILRMRNIIDYLHRLYYVRIFIFHYPMIMVDSISLSCNRYI